ncbi:hypothetical protein [Nonomuraea longicatena]|uniref:Uncharacterized protein n=1 Tax=Nonomuraea longicatena TaxID=83682 RepID=A0ABP3ZD70_9ACTN
MGSRAAITTGVLAIALAAIPVAAPSAVAADDCAQGGGLLSGVTGALCGVVDSVTDTVDQLTGNAVEPVTKGLDDTAGDVLGTLGEVVPTAPRTPPPVSRSQPSQQPREPGTGRDAARDTEGDTGRDTGAQADGDTRRPEGRETGEFTPAPMPTSTLLPDTLADVCLPVLACEDQSVGTHITPEPSLPAVDEPRPEAEPEATPPATRAPDERDDAAVMPPGTPAQPSGAPHPAPAERPVKERRAADPDETRVDLLWPHPFADRLAVPLPHPRGVRAGDPASDALGTTLTAVLLLSAVLAARVVQQRRRREEHDALPFDPVRVRGNRHRMA